ncbi:MAG: PQQ-binding-like beta-propeller repeat protein [Phycisphaerae bacterium]
MRNTRVSGIVLAASLVALGSQAARAADWPCWCGPGGGNFSEERPLPASFSRGQKSMTTGVDMSTCRNVKWAARLCSVVYGNPTIANGRVFLGANNGAIRDDKRFRLKKGGVLQCRDEATGKLIWQLIVPHPEKKDLPPLSNITGHNWGVCSSPTVEGDRVYAVTNAADVLCLDVHGLANGNDGAFKDEAQYIAGRGNEPVELTEGDADIIWRFDLMRDKGVGIVPHDAVSSSILIHGEMLYVTTSNSVDNSHYNVPSPDAPSLIVLDKKTGRLVAADNELLGHKLWHGLWSSPAKGTVNGKTLIFFGGGDGVCYAFEPIAAATEELQQLKKVWQYDCNPPHYRYLDGKPIDYYQGDKRKLRKYGDKGNKSDGTYLGPSTIIATPIFHDGRVYVAIGQDPAHGLGRGLLHCIDASKTGDITKTGKVWSYDGIQRSISTVAVADGLVYAPDISGRLHCVDADTGKCHWVHETRHEAWGGPLVADGKVYFNTKRSFWILAAGKEKKVLHSDTNAGSEASPVAANGVLYAVLKGWLWALHKQP